MVDRDYYMQTVNPAHYDIDKDISVEMVTNGNSCYVSIYNDRNDKSVAFQVTKDKLKGLANFLNKNLEHK
jgi:hypothetical protein